MPRAPLHFQGWADGHPQLWAAAQVTLPWVSAFPLTYDINLPPFGLKPFPSCPITIRLCESHPLSVYQLPLGSRTAQQCVSRALPPTDQTHPALSVSRGGAAAITPPSAALPCSPCSQPRTAPHLLLQRLQAVVGRCQAVSVRGQPGPGVRFDQRQRRLVLLPSDVQEELNAERYAPARPAAPGRNSHRGAVGT